MEISDLDIEQLRSSTGVNLTKDEITHLCTLLGRKPSLVEIWIFDIMWSEHCSYKSSRKILGYLPFEGPRVVIGPGEDAGVVRLKQYNGSNYVLVVAHESHNHPSQILPVEGAATGIGGIVRDVYCMGADVVGVMDSLRFGDPFGPNSETVKEIIDGVITGIWEYGNALGVPNLGGDTFFDRCYDGNCLVNVIAIGIATEEDIIRSRVPKQADGEPYDIIIVGKPTDASGFGGATLASRVLDDDRAESISAVQLHDPFLKRVIVEASKVVLSEVRKAKVEIGYKDLGAGGISCAVSELVAAGGYGAIVDLDKVHTAVDDLEPHVIACSETQERFCLSVPARISDRVIRIFNQDFELGHIYRGARASIIGRVTKEPRLIMRHRGKTVVDLPVEVVTRGITYQRPSLPRQRSQGRRIQAIKVSIEEALLAILEMPSICSKHYIFRHYDSEVQGMAVLRPGEADACVISIPGTPIGIATSVDGNPRICRINAYLGGAYAVIESIKNVICTGALPIALTDCLNFGNPEDPNVMYDFEETVRGIGDAARQMKIEFDSGVPIVSGNVSFYNESPRGSIPPSPIVACYGLLDDYSVATTLTLKSERSHLVVVGGLRSGLGGSAFLEYLAREGMDSIPEIDFDHECRCAKAVREIITAGLALSCHDISEGGLLVALSEMMVGGWGLGKVGLDVELDVDSEEDLIRRCFAEYGGFVIEVEADRVGEVKLICRKHDVDVVRVGRSNSSKSLRLRSRFQSFEIPIDKIKEIYLGSLERALR